METTETQTDNEVVRLPLWKHCLEQMRIEGISYGKLFSSEWLESKIKCDRRSMQFGLAISEIRRELEKDGFYLSGRGGKGNQFVILAPESNQNVMAGYTRAALDALKRGVILGTNTRLDSLSENDRRRHESVLEKMAMRAVLMNKATQVFKAVKKLQPNLLE